MWRDLDDERRARVREAERADIAAVLHDSVLQTLSLIQRRSTDPTEVHRLARAQERELREWLLLGVAVDLVTVGDRPVDERVAALLGAVREAMVNAARHAGGAVGVYVECGPERIEAYVRDRGPGFDPAAISPDRLGVRESIIGRMERHGGVVEIRSRPGEGTDVHLTLAA